MVHRAVRADRRRSAQANSGSEDHRISARRRHRARIVISMRSRSMRSGSTGRSSLDFARDAFSRGGRFRAISIRWRCWPAAQRSTARSMQFSRRFRSGPFIFNLGHGVLPETPIAHVERLIARVRGASGSPRVRAPDERHVRIWIKAFHIIAVIAWMAGMLYLPRLFVYHCAAEKGSVQSETFKVMERRLLRAIINPAMIATWVLGLWLAWHGPDSRYGWFASGGCRPRLLLVAGAFRRARIVCPLGEGFRRRPQPAFAEILQDNQRGTDDPDDRHRHPGGAETVLNPTRCQCTDPSWPLA